jgi:hypothetical protein
LVQTELDLRSTYPSRTASAVGDEQEGPLRHKESAEPAARCPCRAAAPAGTGIEPFGIGLTIVEPGAAPTGFGAALATAPVMPEYDGGPAGERSRTEASPLAKRSKKIVAAMLDLVDRGESPLRLPLGADTYRDIRASLVARLAEHDAHRETALSVTIDS